MSSHTFGALDEYEMRHLVAHLAEAGRAADLHRLLALATSDGSNAWYEAKEESGDVDSYMVDLEVGGQEAVVEDNLPLQCRYALMAGSVRSVAGKLSPHLLQGLLRCGMRWQQALGYARQMPVSFSRALGLAFVAEAAPDAERYGIQSESLGLLGNEPREQSSYVTVLSELVPLLPEDLLRDVLGHVSEWPDEFDKRLVDKQLRRSGGQLHCPPLLNLLLQRPEIPLYPINADGQAVFQ